MNEQTRYFGISVGLHGALLTLLFALASGAAIRSQVVTIDFSLEKTAPGCEIQQIRPHLSAPPSHLLTKPASFRQTADQPAKPAPEFTRTPEPAEPAFQPTAAVAQAAAPSTGQRVAGASTAPAIAIVQAASATSNGNPSGEAGVEQVKKKYLKEHFNYIRDLIVKRLAYPPIARRMEWSGKVVLSFIVSEDGEVRSVRVKESSGYTVLDNSAMDTVKRAAPFPRPPVAAEIVMPVLFKLE